MESSNYGVRQTELFADRQDAIAFVLDDLRSYPEYDPERGGADRLKTAENELSVDGCHHVSSDIVDSDVSIKWVIHPIELHRKKRDCKHV